MARMKEKIRNLFLRVQAKYDSWIYWFTYEAINRHLLRYPRSIYFMDLWIKDYYKKHPLSKELKKGRTNFNKAEDNMIRTMQGNSLDEINEKVQSERLGEARKINSAKVEIINVQKNLDGSYIVFYEKKVI